MSRDETLPPYPGPSRSNITGDTGVGKPDPKAAGKPYRADAAGWEILHGNFKDDRCWVCDDPWDELHHLLPRDGAGTWPRGDDVMGNLIPLCRPCHWLVEARDIGARVTVRGTLMPSNLQYLEVKLGGVHRAGAFLARHYPISPELANT